MFIKMLAVVLGKNGFKYTVSITGKETDEKILKTASIFYDQQMVRVIERRRID